MRREKKHRCEKGVEQPTGILYIDDTRECWFMVQDGLKGGGDEIWKEMELTYWIYRRGDGEIWGEGISRRGGKEQMEVRSKRGNIGCKENKWI